MHKNQCHVMRVKGVVSSEFWKSEPLQIDFPYNVTEHTESNQENRFKWLGHPELRTKPPAELLKNEHSATLGTRLEHSSLLIWA